MRRIIKSPWELARGSERMERRMNSLEKEQAFERALAETLRNAIEHEVMGEQNGDGLLGRVESSSVVSFIQKA